MAPSLPTGDDNLDNPYAPPGSAFSPEVPPGRYTPVPVTVGALVQRAWMIYTRRFREVMSLNLAALGINYGSGLILGLFAQAGVAAVRDEASVKLIQIAAMFASFVIQAWLGVGLTMALIAVARGEAVSFERLFRGTELVLTAILATLVFWVAVIAPMGAGYVAGSSVSIFALLALVAMGAVASAYLMTRLGQSYFLVVDWRVGVLESMRLSWLLTRHDQPTIFLVYVACFTICLIGLIPLALGLVIAPVVTILLLLFLGGWLVIAPLASLLLIVTFLALAPPDDPAPSEPDRVNPLKAR